AAGGGRLHGEPFLFGGGCRLLGGGGGRAGEDRRDAVHQIGDEEGAPGRPGGGSGGEGVGLGGGVQQVQGAGRGGGVGDGADGGRVVQRAPGGRLDEEEVVAHQRGDHLDVVGVEGDAGGHVPGDDLAGHRVVAGPALADVVQQRGDEQQVG